MLATESLSRSVLEYFRLYLVSFPDMPLREDVRGPSQVYRDAYVGGLGVWTSALVESSVRLSAVGSSKDTDGRGRGRGFARAELAFSRVFFALKNLELSDLGVGLGGWKRSSRHGRRSRD